MTDWISTRTQKGWQLQRNADGLARLVEPSGLARGATSIAKALIEFKVVTLADQPDDPPGTAILVHGMLGERETFPVITRLFSDKLWSVEHFRYPSRAAQFSHHVDALRRLIAGKDRPGQRLCLVAHSFGCRLVAAALSNRPAPVCDAVFIAPPARKVRWAKIGASVAPVRWFLGGSLQEMADHTLDERALARQRLLVIEGDAAGRGDGWLQSRETHLRTRHERCHIAARHAHLPCHPQTRTQIKRFVRL